MALALKLYQRRALESLERFLDAYGQRLLDLAGLGPSGPGLRWSGD